MSLSGSDGSIVIRADIDPTPAQRQLAKLEKDIEDVESKLNQKETAKTGLEESLNAARQAAQTAEEAVKRLREEVARLNDREWISRQGFTPQQYQTNILDRRGTAAAELKEQEALLKANNKEVKALSAEYQRVSNSCGDTAAKLDRMKSDAGDLVDRIRQEAEERKRENSALAQAEEHASKFVGHVKRLARRIFVFAMITNLLTSMRKQMAATIKNSAEASAALARLKGALLTLAAPIMQVVVPALTWLMNLLAAIVTEIVNIVSILTGKSKQSMEEAGKALYKEADALNATGTAAKKAARQLADFDEINQLAANTAGGVSSSISPDFNLDLNPAMEKLSGIFNKINDVFRTIRAGLDIVIDDLKWSLDQQTIPGSKASWLTAMTALLGATIGFAFGGFSGAVIGLTLGALVGLYLSGFNSEYWKTAMNVKSMWIVVMAGLIGAVLGAAFGGFIGGALGFTLGAILGLYLVKFAEGKQDGINRLFSELMVVLCTLLGMVIGTVVSPGVGTVVGMGIGLLLGLSLNNLKGDPSSVDKALTELGQKLLLGFVAAAFGVGLAAVGIVSGGTALILSLMIGLALSFFVSSVDDSKVRKAASKIQQKDYSSTLKTQSGATFRAATYNTIPKLASGAVIPPNREFLAVLGDQRSGMNIETPLPTMIQAFKEALAEMGYNGRNEAVLMLDRNVLGKVVYRLNKNESRRVGVNLVAR